MSKPTRRNFLHGMLGAAALPHMRGSTDRPELAVRPISYRTGRPLVALQQAFVDLRFGMFNHFNLATFQDREWGDPHDPPTVFHPTGLDTDQ